jgi:hypothetical protein
VWCCACVVQTVQCGAAQCGAVCAQRSVWRSVALHPPPSPRPFPTLTTVLSFCATDLLRECIANSQTLRRVIVDLRAVQVEALASGAHEALENAVLCALRAVPFSPTITLFVRPGALLGPPVLSTVASCLSVRVCCRAWPSRRTAVTALGALAAPLTAFVGGLAGWSAGLAALACCSARPWACSRGVRWKGPVYVDWVS